MERRKFLARFGLGAVGTVIATKVVVEVSKEADTSYPDDLGAEAEPIVVGKGWLEQIEERGNYVLYTDRAGLEAFNNAMKDTWYDQHVKAKRF